MVAHRDVVFAAAVIEQQLREAPVAAEPDEAAPVDIDAEAFVPGTGEEAPRRGDGRLILVDREIHLAHAGPEADLVGGLPAGDKGEAHVVERLLAVAFRPPETRVLEPQGRNLRRRELDGVVRMVDQGHGRQHAGGSRVRQRQDGPHERVGQADAALVGQIDVVPDADVAAAHGRDPVPADGRVHRGVVRAHHAAVLVGAPGGLLLDGAVVRVRVDQHREVVAAFAQDAGHVEFGFAESALDAAKRPAVQEDVRLPVDAVEMEILPLGVGIRLEGVAVPEG